MNGSSRMLAAAIALSLAFQPTVARAAAVVRVSPVNAAPAGALGAAGAAFGAAGGISSSLSHPAGALLTRSSALSLPGSPLIAISPSSARGVNKPAAKAAAPGRRTPPVPASPGLSGAGDPGLNANGAGAASKTRAGIAARLRAVSRGVAAARPALGTMSSENARGVANAHISLLTGEGVRSRAGEVSVPAGAPLGALESFGPKLKPASRNASVSEPSKGAVPAAQTAPKKKRSWFKVFKDPERNKSFWRYFLGEQIYLFGIQMYIVALPYLMKSFTANTLKEEGKLDGTTREALNEMVRQNRSLARIAHWVSQAVSYVAIPLFTKGQTGPKKWLVRTALIRAAVLGGVPAIFFMSGLVSGQAALWILLGLIAAQSFFQGIYVTMSSGADARIIGDSSVTPDERINANRIRTFASAMIAILAPIVAGKIAGLPDFLGKMGPGSAIVYGIYAATVAIAGLVFATIRMLGQPKAASPGMAGGAAEAGPKGIGGAPKGVLVSMKEGIKIVAKNRFLRIMVLMSLIMSLFSDPLVFNVLPEYVSNVLSANPATVDFLMKIPVLGWLMDGLMSTPAGLFGLLMTFASIGSALSTLLVGPLRKLFKRLGFKTEESLTIPFYFIAFLKVPAFWAMIYFPSFWTVLLLYGLQTLSVGFVGLTMTGLYQKHLGKYDSKRLNQVLAAQSFLGILAAIAATYIYGFVLSGVPIATSLMIAAVAITVLGLLRLAAPWLLFTKAQRKGDEPRMTPHNIGEASSQHIQHDPEEKPGKHGTLGVQL